MTEQQAINKVIETANGQVGYREGGNNYNKYAAELDPLKVTYGNKQNMAWCGEFVLWVFYKCFGIDKALEMLCSPKPTGIPLCSSGAKYFKDAGRWSNSPSVGAVIFFYIGGGINHTGIVTAINGTTITTVEGNSSDAVSRRVYTANDSRIAGYGRPKWSVVVENATTRPVTSVSTEIPVKDGKDINASATEQLPILRKGMTGECVRAAQMLLNGRDCSCGMYGADGDFGNATLAACLAFQRRNGLEADGIIGKITWGKLLGII